MIRQATEHDIDHIIPLAVKFWEIASFNIPFDEESTRYTLEMSLDQALLTVADDGKIVGFACGLMSPCVANFEYKVAHEIAFWLEKEYRGSGLGQKLVKSLEDLAREANATLFNVAALYFASSDKAEAIYKKHGYIKTETCYTKVL